VLDKPAHGPLSAPAAMAAAGRSAAAGRRGLAHWLDHEQVLGYLLVGPVVLLILGLVAYPFVVAVGYALSDRTLADEGVFVGLGNFRNLIESQIYRQTLRNTVLFTLGAVALKLLLGLGLGLLLNEAIPFRRLVRAAVLLPWIVPTVLGTMAWLWMFNPNFSVLNWMLVHSGLMGQGLNWLTDPDLALLSVIIVNAWRGTPFIAITVLAGLQSIPKDFYEASTIDGASKWQRFRHITLPLLMPVLLTALVLSMIWTFSDFGIVYGLTQGGPMNSTHVLATLSYQTALMSGNLGEGAAISLTMLPVLLALIVWQLRRVRRSNVA
jgi:multiple sugar transport system permease protein